MDRGVLTVSVKRQEERTENNKFFGAGAQHGHVYPVALRLSENLNADAVEASYTNGVLEVRIPVLEQAKPRKVEVRQGEAQEELAA